MFAFAAGRELPSGQVTFVFTDIEGSTALLNRHDAAFEPLLELHRDIVRTAVAVSGGHEVKTIGDGFLLVFAEPYTAIRACCQAQTDLGAAAWPEDVAVKVRMGIHSGEATSRDGDYVALAVHVAARVCEAAHGGQILVSETTASLLRDAGNAPSLRPLGPFILRGTEAARSLYQVRADGLPDEFPPVRATPAGWKELGSESTPFIGRTEELSAIAQVIDKCRAVTLTGPGGAGKTRLAREAALRMLPRVSGGVRLVELAPLSDPALVTSAVAAAIAVQEEADGSLLESLVHAIGDSELLLVLDNCEHVVEEAASLSALLLRRCPCLRVFATSREPLQIDGEAVWRVPPLSSGDALALCRERVAAARGSSALSASEERALEELVEHLDRIPLALELAAARARSMSLDELVGRIDQRFELLRGGSRAAPARHKTLAATIEWGYELLDPNERVLFRRLAVFAGGCTEATARRVCAGHDLPREDVLDRLARLADQSLLDAQIDGGETRWTMLETLRQFAAARLNDARETTGLRSTHLEWAIEFAEHCYAALDGAEQTPWLASMDKEHANMLEALSWAEQRPIDLLRLAGAMSGYWSSRARPEGRRWLAHAVEVCPDGPAPLRARALYGLGLLQKQIASHGEAEASLQHAIATVTERGKVMTREGALAQVLLAHLDSYGSGERPRELIAAALDFAERADDDVVRAYAYSELGCILGHWRDRAATEAFDTCLEITRALGHQRLLAKTLADRAIEAWYVGDLETSIALAGEGLEISETVEDLYARQFALGVLGEALAMAGDPNEGRRLMRERLQATRRSNMQLQANLTLEQVASLAPEDLVEDAAAVIGHASVGYLVRADEDVFRYERTMKWLRQRLGPEALSAHLARGAQLSAEEAEVIVERLANARTDAASLADPAIVAMLKADTNCELSQLTWLQGDLETARKYANKALEVASASDNLPSTARAAQLLGLLEIAGGDLAAGERRLHEALTITAENGLDHHSARTFEGLAEVALRSGNHDEASRLLGAADRIRSDLGVVAWQDDVQRISVAEQRLRAHVGNEGLMNARLAGRSLSTAEAISWARRARGTRKRPPAGWESLTPTELDVVKLAAQGFTNPEIGQRMFITRGTVKTHLAHVYTKLGVRNRSELASVAAHRFATPAPQ